MKIVRAFSVVVIALFLIVEVKSFGTLLSVKIIGGTRRQAILKPCQPCQLFMMTTQPPQPDTTDAVADQTTGKSGPYSIISSTDTVSTVVSRTATTATRRGFFGQAPMAVVLTAVATSVGFSVPLTLGPTVAAARLEAVNRPDLLPKERGLNVIQTEKFLTSGQVKRMNELLSALERDTGYRVRVLCQNYPNTPGLAIREYWDVGGLDGQQDDKYVVLVVDQFGGRGNVLNFNVGDGVKLALPNVFWTRLQGKYGTTFFVRDNGVDLAAINAVEAIATCLRSEDQFCTNVPEEFPSLRVLGM